MQLAERMVGESLADDGPPRAATVDRSSTSWTAVAAGRSRSRAQRVLEVPPAGRADGARAPGGQPGDARRPDARLAASSTARRRRARAASATSCSRSPAARGRAGAAPPAGRPLAAERRAPASPSGCSAADLAAVAGGRLGRWSARWSRPARPGRRGGGRSAATRCSARRSASGPLDDVEDQLFRFGRILDRRAASCAARWPTPAPRPTRQRRAAGPAAGRQGHPDDPAAARQAVRLPRGRSLDARSTELAELAAARRQRSSPVRDRAVAARPPAQEHRLAAALARIYGRPMSLQIELDPALLGGLVVRVGDEVIDGSVAGRLGAARRRLPR